MKKLKLSLVVFFSLLGLGVSGLLAADGATLYKRCAACHGPAGDKVPPGVKMKDTINALSKEKIVSDLKGYKAKTLNQYGSGPIMSAQVANLSDADIEAVAEYVSNLKK